MGTEGPGKIQTVKLPKLRGGGRGPTRSLGALRAPTPTLVCVRPTIRTKNKKLGGGLTDTCRGQTWMVAVLVVGMAVCVCVLRRFLSWWATCRLAPGWGA